MWDRRDLKYLGQTSKEWKRNWLDSKASELVKKGHSKQYARAKAKYLYREMCR